MDLGSETNFDLGNLSLVHIFYARSFIKEYQQTILSDTYDLLSILGGVFSVMLGISLISVVELFFYISGKFMTIWNYSPKISKVEKVTFAKGIKIDATRQSRVRTVHDNSIGNLANLYWSEIAALPQRRRVPFK